MPMGSVLVAAMARGRIGKSPSDKVHPFFSKATGKDASPGYQMIHAATSVDDNSALNGGDENRRKKRRKTESEALDSDPEPRKSRRKKGHGPLRDSPTSSAIASPLAKQSQSSSAPGPQASATCNSTSSASRSLATEQPTESELPNPQSSGETAQLLEAPRQNMRYLKFNPKTGTLGSPPKQNRSNSPSMLVHIQYGHDDETRRTVGAKVTQILTGERQMPDDQTGDDDNSSLHVCKSALRKQDQDQKTTHPFFFGKSRSLVSSEQSKSTVPTQRPAACKNSVFMSTPVSPRKQRNPFTPTSSNNMVKFGIKSTGVKVPGAMYPMWPAAGMSHVRGPDVRSDSAVFDPGSPLSKKSKGIVTAITPQESILARLLDLLDLQSVHRSLPRDEECFAPAPPELRLPRRRFESGRVLQKWIRSRLAPSLLAPSGPDELSEDDHSVSPIPKAHAAIFRHYHSLLTNLSAFDRSTCENQAWAQKYAPTTAAQVLQAGKEMTLLKQWLEALKVQSIDTGSDGGSDRSKIKCKPRRKKRTKLQGFVVDSDDEANGIDELSGVEDEPNMADAGSNKRSLIRTGDTDFRSSRDSSRLRNTIVISGPHGCGKTAAVYAVAKEIGFEVFEINSGSRRSGKDILEKVGDMTRNHLVQRHKNQPPSATAAVVETDEKCKGSKKPMLRGLMSSFLKSKPATVKAKATTHKAKKDKSETSPATSAPQSQKQSLILLEEADVLYEEDKQFWQTLVGMMMQSKRPFVVTCSDESLIPLQSLNLHGIFRFTPPQPRLAVDVCLLIAANEGHALERKAVESLYRSRGDDLRATISELNYWCQTGIGDRRGGSDWFYPRWPKGSDVDAGGDVIRVISEGTYLRGMGWIGRDPFATAEPREAEEDALRQAWDSWQVDMGDWSSWCDVEVSTPTKPSSPSSSPPPPSSSSSSPSSSSTSSSSQCRAKVKALAAYDEFCCAMSGSDLCAGAAFGNLLQEPIDCTLPHLPSGVRDDYIIGRTLLEADSMTSMRSTTRDMAITIKSLARASLVCSADRRSIMRQPKAVDELRATRMLDRSFRTGQRQLTRHDLSLAFDPIAASAKTQTLSHLEPSVFDRTLRLIVLDVAPWVRSIIVFERQLMRDRVKLSNLLSQGGKRRRTTRAAYSALEGGERRTTRREKYFGSGLSSEAVMLTGATSFVQGEGHDAAEDD
ncbi:hypothetical protein L249_2449 [Ophiocordyceps polyrhachis-furcata BCC 54312]|uniref:AAA+ ATPase domain-containing protein n=1 Tax=Ophiocordyceps polyrhachis-furcata BCC 54312 TaxID=1330021 RepID=A0A367LS34_9HYPO|nr:hypothetical protein L249_2449 [Ophiocordyceps polyrhachis-furcata BCC 54312]